MASARIGLALHAEVGRTRPSEGRRERFALATSGLEQALVELVELGYVANTRSVTVRRDVAIVVGDHTINLSQRDPDGAWRLVAAILQPKTPHK